MLCLLCEVNKIKYNINRINIFISYYYVTFGYRYTYDPFYCSPNDNFEEELPITAGDYILVWGNKDEVRSNITIIF